MMPGRPDKSGMWPAIWTMGAYDTPGFGELGVLFTSAHDVYLPWTDT
jgi:beta-glucanase (GH16 family)